MDHENRMRRDAAFAGWYTAHHDRIRSLCSHILRDAAAAEDIAQETLLRAWARRESIREDDVGAWLSVVARNACVSYLRKHGRTVPVDVLPETPDDAGDPSLIYERKEARRAVRRALSEVGERHRRLLYLREMEEVGLDELGSEMGLTAGGTRALLFRARATLRERLVTAGQGLGGWLVGVRTRFGRAYRQGQTTMAGGNAAPLMQAGINLALAAGLAVASIAGADLLLPAQGRGRLPSASVISAPVAALGADNTDQVGASDTSVSPSSASAGASRDLMVGAGETASVRPRAQYDKKTQDHFFGVFVDTPAGERCVCLSGRQEEGGHSITWDVIVNPTIERICDASQGYCHTG